MKKVYSLWYESEELCSSLALSPDESWLLAVVKEKDEEELEVGFIYIIIKVL